MPSLNRRGTIEEANGPKRAVEYLRMSTEHQKYSTANQAEAIRLHAGRGGYQIVRTYSDAGKSGLTIKGRSGLRALIADVNSGYADFEIVLVYDVSRWGRFQDTDESAYYEFQCKKAGVSVEYCGEAFQNDGSFGSAIQKMLKREMAAEYSRDLSRKVFSGQSRLSGMGFRQGGPPGFGLRRSLVDESGQQRVQLSQRERKFILSDRVILVPGPQREVDIVREIYHQFVDAGRHEGQIATQLNARGIPNDYGRPWKRDTVYEVLTNEKYLGNNVWNRRSTKLKKNVVHNPPWMWIRANGAFTPIITKSLFEAAQAIIAARPRRLSNAQLLEILRRILGRRGRLSREIIDQADDSPSSCVFRSRFGSLLHAYSLVGYAPDLDLDFVAANARLRQYFPLLVSKIVGALRRVGAAVIYDSNTRLIWVNDELSVSLLLSRQFTISDERIVWIIHRESKLRADLTIAARMRAGETDIKDFYLLPYCDPTKTRLRVGELNEPWIDAYKFETLDHLYDLVRRVPVVGGA
jgi:DNA invertase Pin-like site-specific DNA recombinase